MLSKALEAAMDERCERPPAYRGGSFLILRELHH